MEWLLLVGGIVLVFVVIPVFRGNPKFWSAVRAHPEEAWAWFHVEDAWVVAESKPGSEYTGPFRVTGADGRGANVFGHHKLMDDSERRFLERLAEIRAFEAKFINQDLSPGSILSGMMDGTLSQPQAQFAKWLSADPVTATVAGGRSTEDFDELYSELMRGGVGQEVAGRWAAVAMMTNPRMLQGLIEAPAGGVADRGIGYVLELRDG